MNKQSKEWLEVAAALKAVAEKIAALCDEPPTTPEPPKAGVWSALLDEIRSLPPLSRAAHHFVTRPEGATMEFVRYAPPRRIDSPDANCVCGAFLVKTDAYVAYGTQTAEIHRCIKCGAEYEYLPPPPAVELPSMGASHE